MGHFTKIVEVVFVAKPWQGYICNAQKTLSYEGNHHYHDLDGRQRPITDPKVYVHMTVSIMI